MGRWLRVFCLSIGMLLVASTSAAAAYSIAPGGSISLTSLGSLGFQSDIVTLNCNVALTGTLYASVSGLPSIAGTMNTGTATGCESGFTAELLFNTPWFFLLLGVSGSPINRALFQFGGVGFGVFFLGRLICLFTGNMGMEYSERGLVTLLANSLVGQAGTSCEGVTGSFASGSQLLLAPAQDIS